MRRSNEHVRRLFAGFLKAADNDVALAAERATSLSRSLRSVGKVARGRPAPFTFVLNRVARALRAAAKPQEPTQ